MSTLRDELRSKIFATHELSRKIISIFGAEIELRQPTLTDVMKIQQDTTATEDGQVPLHSVVAVLLRYAYIPGTNDKVFEEADADSIMALPFGQDMINVTEALTELTKVNFTPKKDTSDADKTST